MSRKAASMLAGSACGKGRQGHVDRIERQQRENMPGVDRVRIAQPVLDFGHRERQRPRADRRLGRWLLDRFRCGRWPIQLFGETQIDIAGLAGVVPAFVTSNGFQAVQKAGGDSRRAADLGGMGQDHLRVSQQLREVVRS
jgi:hypothetical protein